MNTRMSRAPQEHLHAILETRAHLRALYLRWYMGELTDHELAVYCEAALGWLAGRDIDTITRGNPFAVEARR